MKTARAVARPAGALARAAGALALAFAMISCDKKSDDAADDAAADAVDGGEDAPADDACQEVDTDECRSSLVQACDAIATQEECEGFAGVGLGDGTDYRCGWGYVTVYEIGADACVEMQGAPRCYAGRYAGECAFASPFVRALEGGEVEVLSASDCVSAFEYTSCEGSGAPGCECGS